MARLNVRRTFMLTVLGVSVHLVFLYSIFDIYFKSPVLHGMPSYSVPAEPPAHRLMFIVADGLRADKFFKLNSDGQSRAPFLRSIITNTGVWGVSHTRVPTESRPGHVALIAGFYEDVSAVAKGWKENPVEFDSVFNQSRFTWSWGSPDIVLMFAKGTASSHVFTETYDAKDEDFAAVMPSKLDTWVFNKFKDFLQLASQNDTLSSILSEDKNIFFLHLLGLDTNGHAHNPTSDSYLDNIDLVDTGIQECVNLLEDYFQRDEKTAYIFTSDHGMTDWGSHGAGHRDETYTPFVAWGAGIRRPLGSGRERYHDGLSEEWNLSGVQRVDINQADVAPLMATLIGIPFPVNSVGVLPIEYLNTDWHHRYVSLMTNAQQILAQYDTKVEEVKATSLIFRQFKDFTPARRTDLEAMMDILAKQKRYQDAIQVCMKIIELALKGLDYYQKYDRFILKFAVVTSYLGWMVYLIATIFQHYTRMTRSKSLEHSIEESEEMSLIKIRLSFLMMVVSVTSVGILYSLSSPMGYYVYFLMPVFLWSLIIYKLDVIENIYAVVQQGDNWLVASGVVIVGVASIEILVGAFFKRWLLSVGLIFIAAWPFCTTLWTSQKLHSLAWIATCGIMAIFPFLPVVGRESDYRLVTFAGILVVIFTAHLARRPEIGLCRKTVVFSTVEKSSVFVYVLLAEISMLILATYNVYSTTESMTARSGLPIVNQIISWTILVLSLILPLMGPATMVPRLLSITASVTSSYVLMCVSYEGIFCLGLCALMYLWIRLEHSNSDAHVNLETITFDSASEQYFPRRLQLSDLRRAYFFIFFIILAFFGTGNIASINSFELLSVYRFLTVFNPFVMGALMLVKIMIPFLLVSCFFRALLIVIKISHQALVLLYVLISDIMGLHFFFLVQDSGSWLDIGTSISHYVIAMTVTIFVLVLHSLAWFLTSYRINIPVISLKRHRQ